MKSRVVLNYLIIVLLISFELIMVGCKKLEIVSENLDPRILEAKSYFDSQMNSNQQILQSQGTSFINLKRVQSIKTPLWNKAETKTLSNGEVGIKVPIEYKSPVKMKLGRKQESVSIDSISYLLIYKDHKHKYNVELVLLIPDAFSWDNRYNSKTNFSGFIMVEDWFGNSIKAFKVEVGGKINYLIRKEKEQKKYSDKSTNSTYYNQVCYDVVKWEIDVCSLADGSCETYYDYETYCVFYPLDKDDSTGGGGTSVGDYTGRGGGTTIGSQGSNGNISTLDPLQQLFINEINTAQAKPCIQNVVEGLKSLTSGTIPNVIQTFAQSPVDFGWNWTIKSQPYLNNMYTDAVTSWPPISNNVETIISQNYSDQASHLSLARTIIHESVHAFLSYYYRYDPNCNNLTYGQLYDKFLDEKGSSSMDDAQHFIMSLNFVNSVSISLQEYALLKGISINDPTYFNDMAWAGLSDTKAFRQLSSSERSRILKRLAVEKTNTTIDSMNPLGGANQCNSSIQD